MNESRKKKLKRKKGMREENLKEGKRGKTNILMEILTILKKTKRNLK